MKNIVFLKLIIFLVVSTALLSSCGIYKPVDARNIPTRGEDRVKKNIYIQITILCVKWDV